MTLTKIQFIFGTPCIHVDRCSVACELKKLINLIGHRWYTYFSEHIGYQNAYVFPKISNQIQTEQNYLLPELFRGKSGTKYTSKPFKTVEFLEKK